MLHLATSLNRIKLVDELIGLGARVNTKDEIQQNSPLHLAARIGNPELLEILIQAGEKVNAVNAINQTPLHLAKNSAAIEKLLEEGADINKEDKNGRTITKIIEFNEREVDRYGKVLIVEHIEKLRILDYKVSEINITAASNINNLHRLQIGENFKTRCDDEIKELKREKLGIYNLFQILKTKSPILTRISRGEKYLDWYRSKHHLKLFPIFGGLIDSQLIRGLERRAIKESIEIKIDKIWKIDLPQMCKNGIIELLTNEDLKNIKKTPLEK